MICSIHQPNFVPWLPFFRKMAAVDLFVILGCCQFEKNGYQNRFHVGEKWYTMSVQHGLDPINRKQYVNPVEDWSRICGRFPQLEALCGEPSHSLFTMNVQIIREAAKVLGIKTRIAFDYPTPLTGSRRLVDLCQYYGCTTYFAGSDSVHYLQEERFEEVGILVVKQQIDEKDRIPLVKVLS